MIILDTNVVSVLMQVHPDEVVRAWLNEQVPEFVWLTSISVFEVRYGLALLPPGQRRQKLEKVFEETLNEDLGNRILPFDAEAARHAADLSALRRKKGRTVDFRDTQIAGIALARRATLVTRNVKHFKDLPVKIVNPWE